MKCFYCQLSLGSIAQTRAESSHWFDCRGVLPHESPSPSCDSFCACGRACVYVSSCEIFHVRRRVPLRHGSDRGHGRDRDRGFLYHSLLL